MSIGKSLRFEVFARDGFACQYCGQRPPDVVLECDHIHPRSKGGIDDSINLTTACEGCNRGKSAKVLGEFAPRPDADLKYLKLAQEAAEIERYLDAKAKLDLVLDEACDNLTLLWKRFISDDVPGDSKILQWIKRYGPAEVDIAIMAAGRAKERGKFGWTASPFKVCPYVGAILRDRETEAQLNG